jgi:hypothetical protein
VKLRKTGLLGPVVVPVPPDVELDADELPEVPPPAPPPDPPDEPEAPDMLDVLDEPDAPDELDELLDDPDPDDLLELLLPEPPLEKLDEDEPAFFLAVFLVVVVSCPVPPVPEPLPLWPAWPPDPYEPCPDPEPVCPDAFPAALPCVPPISPIKASTWHRTVVLLALSTEPFSTTYTSISPRSTATNSSGDFVAANSIGGRYPACHAAAAPRIANTAARIFTAPQALRRTCGISIVAKLV